MTSQNSTRPLTIVLIAFTALTPVVMYALASPGAAEAGVPLFRELPRIEQLILAGAVYPIKLTYMLAALAGALALWQQRSPSLAAVRWSMVFSCSAS